MARERFEGGSPAHGEALEKVVALPVPPKDSLRTVVLSLLGLGVLRAIEATLTWEVALRFPVQGAVFATLQRPFIVAFWHNKQLLMSFLYLREGGEKGRIHTLISQHRDGRLIARVVGYLGIQSVAGSSTRGGSTALRALVRVLRNGGNAAVTPDGPKGPVFVAKPGVIALASMSGAPIVPLSYVLDRKWVLKSWDRMEIPKPFARVTTGVGEPLLVPRDLDDAGAEHYRRELEKRLNDLTNALEERRQEAAYGPR